MECLYENLENKMKQNLTGPRNTYMDNVQIFLKIWLTNSITTILKNHGLNSIIKNEMEVVENISENIDKILFMKVRNL